MPVPTHAQGVSPVRLALVSLGGALGSASRYWLWQQGSTVASELRATFVTSVVGCFVLGVVLGLTSHARDGAVRVFAIGLCGGFASFSVYAVLGVAFATRWFAVVFLVVTPIAALGAMGIGALLTSRVMSR